MALTPPHFLANLLDPRYTGSKLNQEQLDATMEYVVVYHPNVMPEIIKYRARSPPFKEYLFSEHALVDVIPITWGLAQKQCVSAELMKLVQQLHTAIASSAGIERLFSSFGFVHSKIKNKLGVEKASKLVSVFKALNQ